MSRRFSTRIQTEPISSSSEEDMDRLKDYIQNLPKNPKLQFYIQQKKDWHTFNNELAKFSNAILTFLDGLDYMTTYVMHTEQIVRVVKYLLPRKEFTHQELTQVTKLFRDKESLESMVDETLKYLWSMLEAMKNGTYRPKIVIVPPLCPRIS